MWESTLGGRRLTFHLVGLNNRNFIMQDEETGTWWQQVTGRAILGPLKGSQLKLVPGDTLTFDTWRRENSQGRVLCPDAKDHKWKEFADEFEKEAAASTPDPRESADGRPWRKHVVAGVVLNDAAKAYLLATLRGQSSFIDTVGGVDLLVVMADDNKSVRVFETNVEGRDLEFYAKPGEGPLRLVDQETGSEWDFRGRCLSGPLTGSQLKKVNVLTEYFFDWKNYHPTTTVYKLQPG